MKSTLTRLLLVSLLFATPAFRALAQEKGSHEEETELGNAMAKMGKAFRQLGRQVGDASKNEDSLKLVAALHEGAEKSLALEPAKKAEIPAAEQEKFVADYRAGIKKLLASLDELAVALKAGNNDEAKKIVAHLKDQQKDGHAEFRKKEDK